MRETRETQQHRLRQLLRHVDFEETFMRGHAVGGTPEASHQTRMARTPTWALTDDRVRELLRKVFPKMDSDPTQRERALRWVHIIYYYFRAGWTTNMIAGDMAMNICRGTAEEFGACEKRQRRLVKKAIYRIKKAAAGLRTTGKPRTRKPKKERPRTGRPRGRPKKERDASF